MKVLVADDNAENRYFLEVLLKARGDEVVSAADGFNALECLRQGPVDLIISDVLMPRMDGYRFCRECKQAANFRDIPFIFVTAAYTDDKDERFALSLGADRYVRRPIDPVAFLHIVDDLMEQYRKQGPTSPATTAEVHYLTEYSQRVESQLARKVRELEGEIAQRQKVERALRTLSSCNQAMIRATDENELLEAICRILVDVGGYRSAWVGLAEHDPAKTVSPVPATAPMQVTSMPPVSPGRIQSEAGARQVRRSAQACCRSTRISPTIRAWLPGATRRCDAVSPRASLCRSRTRRGDLGCTHYLLRPAGCLRPE